jgi:inosose dehydratase
MDGFQPDPPLTYLDFLDQVVAAGFAGTELGDWGFMPDDPAMLKPELERRKLAMVGAFTPVELTDTAGLEDATNIALRTARLLAAVTTPESAPGPYLVLAASASRHPHRRRVAGRVTADDGLTRDEFTSLARGVESVALKVLDETGVPTAFHPHCAAPVETAAEALHLAEMTDEKLVGFCYDTGHVAYAGDDPIDAIRQLGSRISLVHYKDMDSCLADSARENQWDYALAVREGLFCELGRGCIDFPGVTAALLSNGYEGWIVVEDELPPGRVPPLEAAIGDRAYLRSIGL